MIDLDKQVRELSPVRQWLYWSLIRRGARQEDALRVAQARCCEAMYGHDQNCENAESLCVAAASVPAPAAAASTLNDKEKP